jgi:NitT/TauT family transport system permease protein
MSELAHRSADVSLHQTGDGARSRWVSVILAALSILLAWQALAMLVGIPILPTPLDALSTLARELTRELGIHFLASLLRVVVSITLAVLLATPAGLMLGQSEKLDRLFSPFVYLLYPIPKVVLVPIVLLFLGVGNAPKVVIVTMILFFQVLVLVRDSAASIRPEILTSVRSLGAGRRALFRFVYLPAGVPAVLTAVRQSIGTAVAVLYIAELFATRYGLGYYIYLHGSTLFNYPKMYAGVIAMSVLGLGLYFVVDAVETRVCRWMDT